jgi:hypothetical protein
MLTSEDDFSFSITANMRDTDKFFISYLRTLIALPAREGAQETDLDILAYILQRTDLTETQRSGSYLDLEIPDVPGSNIAVKVFRYSGRLYEESTTMRMEQAKKINPQFLEELQYLADNPRYVYMAHRNDVSAVSTLPEEDQHFIFMAYEHAKFMKLYREHVLPALFVAYQKIDAPKEIVYSMVQQFVPNCTAVSELSVGVLTPEQQSALREFTGEIEHVYEKTGYYPDPSFLKPESHNLVFTANNRLLLVDTNHLMHRDQDIQHRYDALLSQLHAMISSNS